MPIALLPRNDDSVPFPAVETAAREPNGLLAVGGSLRPRRLLAAYRQGIFPWFGEGEPILWWSPDPRCVLFPEHIHVSRRLRRTLNRGVFTVTRNLDFEGVVRGCAEPRAGSPGTWIVPEMIDAYLELHRLGFATSFECTDEAGRLAGGIYGVQLGRVFFGESMFSRATDASKVALAAVAGAADIELIDCQLSNPHLERMGAEEIPRSRFRALISRLGAADAD
jgi:leucyl/phenylalanyl-tRNA--protein transferase